MLCIAISGVEDNFGPKRAEVRGEWRKLHNEELLTQYCAGD
jgi:hypothetical protein